MTGFVNAPSSRSQTRADTHQALPATSLNTRSSPSTPIPIPRRRTAHPPPRSPTRDQNSPELVFNFDFSVSPEDPKVTSQLMLQQRGLGMRCCPLQQNATHTPLAALGINHGGQTHPYAREPFLYTVPKQPLADAQNTHGPVYENTQVIPTFLDVSKTSVVEGLSSDNGLSIASSASSLSSFQSSDASRPHSADVSMCLDGDENFTLTSAFQRPLVSASVTSSPTASLENASFSPSVFYRSPSPSPPRHHDSRARTRAMAPSRPTALRRTTTAAPVVSLNVVEAGRSDWSFGRERSRSPYSGITRSRTRRSSSARAERGDPGRRMATVVGRGAGRVVSMFEYTAGRGRSLVSDEDIERSLEKETECSAVTNGGGGENASRWRGEEKRQDGEQGLPGSPELERGRARGRASTRGGATTTRTRALPGWQWIDVQ